MIEWMKGIYQVLEQNPIAMSLVVVPTLGMIAIWLRNLPNKIFKFILGITTTKIDIFEVISPSSFEGCEYLLARYNFKSLIKYHVLSKSYNSYSLADSFKVSTGLNCWFYGKIQDTFCLCMRSSDEQSKLEHKFKFTFIFFTRNTEKIKKIFSQAFELCSMSLGEKYSVYTVDEYGNFDQRNKYKTEHKPITSTQQIGLNKILSAVNSKMNRIGVLLYGEPGCGKSNLVEMIIAHTGYNLYYINMKNIRDVRFTSVLSNIRQPSILLFEDIDCIESVHNRKDKKESFSEYVSLNTILNVFDGLLALDKQLIIATTNHREKLDPALVRRGRFDIQIELNKMTNDEIRNFLSNYYQINLSDIKNLNNQITLPVADVVSICKYESNYIRAIECINQEIFK